MSQPKLIYVSVEPHRQGHASYTHVREIIVNLQVLGWNIILHCPSYNEHALPNFISRAVGITSIVIATLFSRRPDIYYMRWHFAALPIALMAWLRRIPIVIEVNGPAQDLFIAWPQTRLLRPLFIWLMNTQLRLADAVITVTDGLSVMCRKIVGSEKRIAIIPNGADTDHFTPVAASTVNGFTRSLPEKFLIFFGTLAPWQGIDTILTALDHEAWPKNIPVLFVADGSQRDLIEAAARRSNRAIYYGRVPYDILPTVVARAAGSLVCSEDIEGRAATGLAPLKLFESIAAGVPVIVTDFPYQSDLVRKEGCGIVIPPCDPTALAHAARALVDDDSKREAMATHARAASMHHSWRQRAADTEKLLRQVLAVKTSPKA